VRRVIVVALVVMALAGSTAVAAAAHGTPVLHRQPTPKAVVAEHLDALNHCKVNRLMAQYPESIAILLPGGVTTEGRKAVRALFEGFCKPHSEGGLKGLQFTTLKSWTVAKNKGHHSVVVINVQWVANAPFLTKPYYGADAYETRDGLMAAQVTTFDGNELEFNDTYTAISVKNPNNPAEVSGKLVRESSPDAVLAQHMKALNACDWKGLMQQYPDSYELRLPGGTVVKGRQAAAETFAGFVKPHASGGLCGITFTEESRLVTNGTLAVQWVANADFLAEPYRGSDAYITDDGLMVSMVSTFDGAELKFKP
jgi:ketosteroid isomerase-like protein